MINVILSGGVGSRLWPLSRKSRPKQYIPLFGEKSLFQLSAERNKALAEKVAVVGNAENYQLSRSALEAAGISDFLEIVEAAPRNTAAAIAFAAFAVEPAEVLLVCPSDHVISDEEAYKASVSEAAELARQGFLVTFGIVPTKPETGFGYIEFEGNDVKSFREKPSFKDAQTFVESGHFLWNSGMFCFQAKAYLDELQKYEPGIYSEALKAWENRSGSFLPLSETMQIPSQSIDYAVMERSDKIKVVPATFGWSDLGSFESIWEYFLEAGEKSSFVNNNMVLGVEKHVEFLGVENLIVVNTEDAILVLSKSASQDVKKIYERLETEKPHLLA